MHSALLAPTLKSRARLLSGAAVMLLAIPQAAAAQEAIALDQVVVTAAGFEQLLKDAPASITVVTSEELRKKEFSSLNDALKGIQGVSVTGIANESDIYIRGLSGSYTLILVDGKRQSTRDARTNGNAGYEQSYVPPVSAIERIEVVRGPMSSLYGSDAMGGVINIITKKVSPVWEGEVSVDTTANSDKAFGDKRQLSFYANGPVINDKLGLQIWGRQMKRDASDVSGGAYESNERDLTARLTWTPSDQQDISFELGTTNIERPSSATNDNDNSRDHMALSHIGRWSFGTSEVSLSHETAERQGFTFDQLSQTWLEDARSPKIANTVLDVKLNTQLGANAEHNLTFGGQFFRAELNDQNPGRRSGVDETFRADQRALFIENEWQIDDTFALTAGLRYNDHSEYDGHFTPRLYGVWNATEALTIKGGVSTGFRAPDVRNITPGYAYTTGGGSCSAGAAQNGYAPSCGVIMADPNLKPEKSTSFELGVLYEEGPVKLGATVFHTKFKDKITNALTDPLQYSDLTYPGAGTRPSNTGLFNYRLWYNSNVDEAQLQGIELTGDWEVSETLKISANYTYTDSKQQTGAYVGYPLARTPEHMANLRLDWSTPVEGMNAWLSANYHGSEVVGGTRLGSAGSTVAINGVEGKKYAAYRTVDIGANYAINDKVDFGVAVYNLLGETVENDTHNTSMEGRRAWLGLTTRF